MDGIYGESMTNLYDKVKENLTFRRMGAEKCGIGVALPNLGLSVVQNVPKRPK